MSGIPFDRPNPQPPDHQVRIVAEFVGAAASVADTRRVITEHPELLQPSADLLLARMIEGARRSHDDDSVRILTGRRQLLDECRRLGVAGAMIKYQSYVMVNGFLAAQTPASKLRYVLGHPEILEGAHDIVLYQLIDQARQAGDANAARFFEQHLWLLTMSRQEGPQQAFARAFGPGVANG
jgi:hypothetical protein